MGWDFAPKPHGFFLLVVIDYRAAIVNHNNGKNGPATGERLLRKQRTDDAVEKVCDWGGPWRDECRAALVDEDTGEIVARADNVPSKAMLGSDLTAGQIAAAVDAAIAQAGVDRELVRGIGLAVPGHIHPFEGMVLWAPELLRTVAKRSVGGDGKRPGQAAGVLGQDSNFGAGEWKYGSGKGTRHLVMLTLGTGVGGGVIIDGRMLLGQRRRGGVGTYVGGCRGWRARGECSVRKLGRVGAA